MGDSRDAGEKYRGRVMRETLLGGFLSPERPRV